MDNKKINRTRNNKITVYFSDAELERLNSKVDRTLLNREQFIRNMIEEVKRESGLDEVESEFKNMERTIDESVRAADIRPELQKTQLSINKELNEIKKDVSFKDFKSNMGGKSS